MAKTKRTHPYENKEGGEHTKPTDNRLKCSFCGKSQDQVKKLIAGPGVYVCDECVDLCNEILDEELLDKQPTKSLVLQKFQDPEYLESSSVSYYSADLKRLHWMTKDKWRGQTKPEDDPVRTKLILEALKKLEALVNHDLNSGVTWGSEPVLRALLCLKEQSLGNNTASLLDPLSRLAALYAKDRQLHLAAGVQEWYLEIASKTKDFDQKKLIEETYTLAKLWLELGCKEEARDLMQVIVEMKLKS